VPDLDIAPLPAAAAAPRGTAPPSAAASRDARLGRGAGAGNDMQLSVEKGEPVAVPLPNTIADALRPCSRRAHLALVRASPKHLTVSDLELRRAMPPRHPLKIVVEPGGAPPSPPSPRKIRTPPAAKSHRALRSERRPRPLRQLVAGWTCDRQSLEDRNGAAASTLPGRPAAGLRSSFSDWSAEKHRTGHLAKKSPAVEPYED